MQHYKLVFILAACLVLKATMVAGAEMENSGSENINVAMAMEGETIANPDYVQPDPYALDWKQVTKYAHNESTDSASDVAPMNNNVRINIQDNDNHVSSNRNDANANANAAQMGATMNNSNPTVIQTAITPMIGFGNYYGAWGDHVSNSYSLGLGIELATSSLLSFELEGGYSKNNVAYQFFRHDFNLYNIGGNAKLYVSRSMIQPWIGVGATGLYYENMTHGPSFPYSRYSQWIGAIQPIAGLDVEVAKGIAVGVRGAYVIPVINKPKTLDNGTYSYPYYEEAGLMNTSYYKAMADVKFMF